MRVRPQSEHSTEPLRLRFIWGIVRRNAWIIMASAVACGAIAVYLTRNIVPTYVASASIRIDQRQTDLPALDILRLTSGNEVNTEM
ncbi:MAG TPA: Wzz/FepE/Etk N-terminal domain-containing protein, partial [Gemmatimonadales bacterium]|nr:Wzz/FepE/Etk N-terminal domain-containing protein [Gemmatimonadales bacterium]